MAKIIARRICWPNPDATCLEGGCGYCNDEKFQKLEDISDYAWNAGRVHHRGGQSVDAWDAYNDGLGHGFWNAEVKYDNGEVNT
ncbi:hypothetical protein BH766_gp74 [Gordonia phage Demosthenes]|uniref:Uncharacterized protein n=2 Tax=Demosthenesvirus demosthenes TaxID=1982107 RepID=A0A5J6TCN5_9CAUD|nr:hypothetical protein BH766_gp74 [Gordonia phage Demosthenes]ANA86043.1 hypothetical protein PBI_DEMOSTHENES_74 [Gordonia phage Demosthenes]QFG08560.1 hypothetical protein PBI_ASERPROCKY_74 [Gordonia phage ASerpRocky]